MSASIVGQRSSRLNQVLTQEGVPGARCSFHLVLLVDGLRSVLSSSVHEFVSSHVTLSLWFVSPAVVCIFHDLVRISLLNESWVSFCFQVEQARQGFEDALMCDR